MKTNQLATLILRLLGIYVLVESIPMIVYSAATTYAATGSIHVPALLFAGSRVIIGVLLIIFSVPWGEKFTPKTNGGENASPITFRQVQLLAFAITGVLIFASVLPELLITVYSLLRFIPPRDSVNPYGTGNDRQIIESAIGTLLKAALGIWLFFGADGFANFLSPMRNFATPKPPQT